MKDSKNCEVVKHGNLFETVENDEPEIAICPECGCEHCRKETFSFFTDMWGKEKIIGELIYKEFKKTKYICNECNCEFIVRTNENIRYKKFIELVIGLILFVVSTIAFGVMINVFPEKLTGTQVLLLFINTSVMVGSFIPIIKVFVE